MIENTKGTGAKPPVAYGEWLECLEAAKRIDAHGSGVLERMACGSFAGSETAKAALQKQIVETINVVLKQSIKRFTRALNEAMEFHELWNAVAIFRRLKKEIGALMFFEQLAFLPDSYRAELAESIRAQTSAFWKDTLRFLANQSSEYVDPDLEDALFLIKRMKLFDVQG